MVSLFASLFMKSPHQHKGTAKDPAMEVVDMLLISIGRKTRLGTDAKLFLAPLGGWLPRFAA
jgi:hypothetical protein